MRRLLADPAEIDRILKAGAAKARAIAAPIMDEVKKKVGFIAEARAAGLGLRSGAKCGRQGSPISTMTDSKTVLVTGAAKRLGRVIVLALAEAGWDIALHYYGSHDEAEETARDVRGKGVKVALLSADFADETQTAGLIGQAAAELGPLTALVNSASLFENDDWQSATAAKLGPAHGNQFAGAVFAVAATCQTAAQRRPGTIVNIVDQRVLKPTPQFLSYSLSKAGLYWLTTTLAQALAPDIRVNAVGPGPTIRNARQSEADFARQTQATILGHGARPEEVAAAVLYLLSAGSVTGQMIAVDGGQHLIWQTADVSGEGMTQIANGALCHPPCLHPQPGTAGADRRLSP